MATLRYAAHGPADEFHFEDTPTGPNWLDLSWHQYGRCDNDPKAQEALEQVQKHVKRPWEPWCYDCPVKGHCLQQGLREDAQAPSRQGQRSQPFVYGGLTPSERQNVDHDWLENKLFFERAWLTRRAAAAS